MYPKSCLARPTSTFRGTGKAGDFGACPGGAEGDDDGVVKLARKVRWRGDCSGDRMGRGGSSRSRER
jgi:hypothetical protein